MDSYIRIPRGWKWPQSVEYYVVVPPEKREEPGHCCQSMKHLPDLDVILLVDSDDSRNVMVKQDVNSQMSQPLSYP